MVGGKFPHSTIMEDTCLDAESRTFLDLYKSSTLMKIQTPAYKDEDMIREVKYYYFK